MLRFRGILFSCLLVMLLPAGFVSCEREKVLGKEVREEVCGVRLAMRVGTIPQTKANVSTISEMKPTDASFRGLDQVYVIPFAKSGDAVKSRLMTYQS